MVENETTEIKTETNNLDAAVKTEDAQVEVKDEVKKEETFEKLKEEIKNQLPEGQEPAQQKTQDVSINNDEIKLLKEHNELLRNELTGLKNMISELVNQKQPNTDVQVKYSQKFEDLTQEQQADMLVYGKTFVGEEGKRVPPEYVVVNDNGEILYQTDEEEF